MKNYIIGIAVVSVALLGIGWLMVRNSGQVSEVDFVITEADWLKGEVQAAHTLVEFGDFECGACAGFGPIVDQIVEESEGKIRLVYRHFPIRGHKNSQMAAQAAEAAGKQEKFWEMHDMLYEKQSEWMETEEVVEIFLSYAEALKLDKDRFENDLVANEVKAKVDSDYRSGLSARVNGTPTFFLDGKKLAGYKTVGEFKDLIEKGIGSEIDSETLQFGGQSSSE